MNSPFPETADIHSSTDEYATRFAGEAGQWMLEVQSKKLKAALEGQPPGTAVDVGGGHSQTAPLLRQMGFEVTVTGSDESCGHRLPPGIPLQIVNHLELPYEDQSVDVVICFRFVTHCERWPELLQEFCRVSRSRIILDYPSKTSVNFLAELLFSLKKRFEKNTRTYRVFRHREISEILEQNGFILRKHPQFFFPMVLHRMLKSAKISQGLESAAAAVGLTRLLGSPVVLEARRAGKTA